MKEYNENIIKLVEISRQMVELAEMGDTVRIDKSCGVLYGILRDAGYKLNKLAMAEIETHRQDGTWDNDAELHFMAINH